MILVIGGTSEAWRLCSVLQRRGIAVIHSLRGGYGAGAGGGAPMAYGGLGTLLPSVRAGVVRCRVGGFSAYGLSGVTGFRAYLRRYRVRQIVDASHPFANDISAAVARAATVINVPLVRLLRPPWRVSADNAGAGGKPASVIMVANAQQAASAAYKLAAGSGTAIAVTSGRSTLQPFLALSPNVGLWIRVLAPRPYSVSAAGAAARTGESVVWRFARGPFSLEEEQESMARNGVGVLVTKQSGGGDAKLRAARLANIPVVMIRRQMRLATCAPTIVVGNVSQCLARLERLVADNGAKVGDKVGR